MRIHYQITIAIRKGEIQVRHLIELSLLVKVTAVYLKTYSTES